MHTISRTLVLGTLLAILVAACSSGGGTAAPAAPESEAPASVAPASEAPASDAPASEAPASAAAGGPVTVMVADRLRPDPGRR